MKLSLPKIISKIKKILILRKSLQKNCSFNVLIEVSKLLKKL